MSDSIEKHTLSKATLGASLGIFLSRFSGVFRSQIVSGVFGAGVALDAFNLAFRFPNALRDLFADGALASAFTKALVEAKLQGIQEEKKLISIVTAFFAIITICLSILGFIFSYEFMELVASPFFSIDVKNGITSAKNLSFAEAGGIPLASIVFKFLVFYLPIAMFSSTAMAALSARQMTFRATFSSAFFNVGSILGALLLAPLFNYYGFNAILGLAVGTLLGGIAQFTSQVIPLYKLGVWAWPRITLHDVLHYKPLHEIFALMLPRTLAQGSMIIALLINTQFAAEIGVGALTIIANTITIILVPVGLFGVAAGFSALPMLTECASKNDGKTFQKLLSDSLNSTQWLANFSITCFAILGAPFALIMFGYGNYSTESCMNTAIAIAAYSIGILFNSSNKVLQQGFFALGNTKQVLINSVIYLAVNASLSSILAPRLGIVGLGLSNSISASIDFGLNLYFLQKLSLKKGENFRIFSAESSLTARKMAARTGFAFIIGLMGVVVSSKIWQPIFMLEYFSTHSRFITWGVAFLIVIILGSLILLAFKLFIVKYGPAALKGTVNKVVEKGKRLLVKLHR